MKEQYKAVYLYGEDEIVEKKSRFIAHVEAVNSEEEAVAFIEKTKKEYWDARHNCFAFSVGIEQPLLRFSDDGEPQGTAGKPILEVITRNEIHNVVVVVTRYFGGTLLGTGGLVRAYTQAAKAGLDASIIVEHRLGVELEIITDYNGVGKLQYLFANADVEVLSSDYQVDVTQTVLVPKQESEQFIKKVTETTNGQAKINKKNELYYFKENNTVHTQL